MEVKCCQEQESPGIIRLLNQPLQFNDSTRTSNHSSLINLDYYQNQILLTRNVRLLIPCRLCCPGTACSTLLTTWWRSRSPICFLSSWNGSKCNSSYFDCQRLKSSWISFVTRKNRHQLKRDLQSCMLHRRVSDSQALPRYQRTRKRSTWRRFNVRLSSTLYCLSWTQPKYPGSRFISLGFPKAEAPSLKRKKHLIPINPQRFVEFGLAHYNWFWFVVNTNCQLGSGRWS